MVSDDIRFGPFQLSLHRRGLSRDNRPVRLGGRPLDILCALASARGEVVSKDELMARLWPGRVIEEGNIHVHVSALRRALDDHGEGHSYIVTVPGRGYRLAGLVEFQGTSALAVPAVPEKPSIAVLPFSNMSNDLDQEYVADGLAEDVTTGLSRVRWLFVIARSSSFTYKGKAADVKRIGRELGVRYVLEGSLRKAGQQIRVTAQLVEAETGIHVWAERYDRPVDDIFAVQDEITDTIVATLEPEISAAERDRAWRRAPEDLGAWEQYQRGTWHLLRRTRQDFDAAEALFRKAIELDPNFASPHAGLAIAAFFQITHGFTSNQPASIDKIFTEASSAIALDPKDALAHTALGLAFMERRERMKAFAKHQEALGLNPNSAFAHYAFGYALLRADRFNEAVEQLDFAIRLSPRDPGLWSYLAVKASALYQLGRYSEAAEIARDAARHPQGDLIWPRIHLLAALGQLGYPDEASAPLEELRQLRPGLTVTVVKAWPHNQSRSVSSLEHLLEGLRKAGLPEE